MTNLKTAISLQEDFFQAADEMAHSMRISRSRLFALALQDFLDRKRNHRMLDQINRAHNDDSSPEEQKLARKMRRVHRRQVEDQW